MIYTLCLFSRLFDYAKGGEIYSHKLEYNPTHVRAGLTNPKFIYLFSLLPHWHRCIVIIKKGENVDLCACMYEIDDADAKNLLGVLMTTTPMIVEVSDNIFPTL